MVNLPDLLSRCKQNGVTLAVKPNGELRVDSLREIDFGLLHEVKQNEAAIVAHLSHGNRSTTLFAKLRQSKIDRNGADPKTEPTEPASDDAEPVGQVDELEAIAFDELPLPCPDCRSFDIWEAGDGQRYCSRCNPPPEASNKFWLKRLEWDQKNQARMQREADKNNKGGA